MDAQKAPAPPDGTRRSELTSWLRALVESGGSDLHLKADSNPRIRVRGRLHRLDSPALSPAATEDLVQAILPDNRRERFAERGEVDFAYSLSGVGRFRVNAFRQRGSCSVVMRQLRIGGPSVEEAGLPPIVQRLSEEPRGLVLVTGPTGSGKTTTLAAMIEHINRSRPLHIVTIEDPIEVLHPDKEASVNQREVGQDTETFLTAIRAALRQDPDVILIGEMRDTETVRAALQAAETGHLVLSTLHTVDATETVNRIVDFFPAEQHHQVRITLAGALRGILSQRLVPSTDGGQVPAVEVLVNTGRVAERIADPNATSEIPEVIAQGSYYGMQTFDQALLTLVREGRVTLEDAMSVASEPHDFQLMLQQAGVTAA
ncbi:MAG TPA: type IV pilus twitching motility protein PilT [Actinomycetota bacterium]|nr:type IV pilus twitching motility protein PilT [Actinomycetota bacterium]